jgi:hypothetical protein
MAEGTAAEVFAIVAREGLDVSKLDHIEKLKQALGKPDVKSEDLQNQVIDAIARHTAATFLQKAKQKGLDIKDKAQVALLKSSVGSTSIGVDELQQMLLFADKNGLTPVAFQTGGGELSEDSLQAVTGGAGVGVIESPLIKDLGPIRTRFTNPAQWAGDTVAHRYT